MERVAVAMSGGVDSSVAAAILVEKGYEVIGFTMNLYENIQSGSYFSNIKDSASEVAKKIGIPHQIIDAYDIFNKIVVSYLLEEYKIGNIPNPCVICNRNIKFSFLYEQAKTLGCSYLATGHYARNIKTDNGNYELYKGEDNLKDQSYFLSYLTQDLLSKTLFPLGEFQKQQVKQKAMKLELALEQKKESQDLCFIKDERLEDFLRRKVDFPIKTGGIYDKNGEYLGLHKGLMFYTIGQRKGLGISYSEPSYVLEKRVKENHLIVGNKVDLGKNHLVAGDVNWISGHPPVEQFSAEVKIRYKAKPVLGTVTVLDDRTINITFNKNLPDITPGQIAVLYAGDKVIGAGKILSEEKTEQPQENLS